jgi:hypothetical protein
MMQKFDVRAKATNLLHMTIRALTVGHWDSRISAKKSIASQACD